MILHWTSSPSDDLIGPNAKHLSDTPRLPTGSKHHLQTYPHTPLPRRRSIWRKNGLGQPSSPPRNLTLQPRIHHKRGIQIPSSGRIIRRFLLTSHQHRLDSSTRIRLRGRKIEHRIGSRRKTLPSRRARIGGNVDGETLVGGFEAEKVAVGGRDGRAEEELVVEGAGVVVGLETDGAGGVVERSGREMEV